MKIKQEARRFTIGLDVFYYACAVGELVGFYT